MKMPTDKSWYGKMAAKEGDHEISAGRRLTSTINPTPEEITEIERLQLEALPAWARDRISQQDAELERLRREIANKEAYFSKCVSNEAFLDQDARRLRQIEALEQKLTEAQEFRAILEGHLSAAIDDYNEARKAAFIEAAEIATGVGTDASNEWPGETWIAESIATAFRAKADETPNG